MSKIERVSVVMSGVAIVVTFLLYSFTGFFCEGNCYPFFPNRFDPLYAGILGLLPTLVILLCFPKKIYVSWIMHIAWWFSIVTAFAVSNTTQNGFFPFLNRQSVALICMAVLFVITLTYALVMERRLKKNIS